MRVGSVAYSTRQGLGWLAKWFYDAGIITDIMLYKHPNGRPSHKEWYPAGTIELTRKPFVGEYIERFMDDLDIMLFFETPHDWKFADRCRERGLKTVIIPMHEWFLEDPPHQFDLFINPSLLDQMYFQHGVYIPIPVPKEIVWQERKTALKFLHSSGNIGCREHKGTRELLQAMQYVKSPIELTVRSQDKAGLERIIKQVPGVANDSRITFDTSDIPWEDLYKGFDVMVTPEKFNGLSLPLQEAFASGLMVITTDRYPTNKWLPIEPLIPFSKSQKARTMGGHLEFNEALVDPQDIAATIDRWYGADITSFSLQGRAYAERNSWEVLKPVYLATLESLLCPTTNAP